MKVLLSALYPYLYVFFCFLLPLDQYAKSVPNIVLIALIAIFPFIVKKEMFHSLKKNELYIFIALVVFITINSLLFNDISEDISVIKKMASAILLFVLFIPIKKTKNLHLTIIGSVLVSIVFCLVNMYFFYLEQGAFNFANGPLIEEVLIIDRLYLGFFCVLSIVSSLGLIGNTFKSSNKWYFANIVLCTVFVLLISSRLAIILLVLLFFLRIFYSRHKKKYSFFLLGISIIVIGAFMLNKNLQERFFYTQTPEDQSYVELFKRWEPRVVIWNCSKEILTEKDALSFGLGFYKTKDFLVECYSKSIENQSRREYFISKRFNAHNQFLDLLLSAGILSLLLFLLFFIVVIKNNYKDFYKMSLIVSMLFFVAIECVFHRQLGGYYFGIFLVLVLFKNSEISHQVIKKTTKVILTKN